MIMPKPGFCQWFPGKNPGLEKISAFSTEKKGERGKIIHNK
jgi:hypothetical protein